MKAALIAGLIAALATNGNVTHPDVSATPLTSIRNGNVGCLALNKWETRFQLGIPGYRKIAGTVVCVDPWGNAVGIALDKKGRTRCWATGTADLVAGTLTMNLCGIWVH